MLYFAYGANLNRRNLKRIAQRAEPLYAAWLPGYRLVFRHFLVAVPDPKGVVHGALYELTHACVRALDDYEGPAYRQSTVTVESADGQRTAMIYVSAGQVNPADTAPPDIGYYNIVARGYADWKLDPAPLRRARYATIRT